MHPSILISSIATLFIASAAARKHCTTTSTVSATCYHGGPTETIYGPVTETATISVDCHGCQALAYSVVEEPCPFFIIAPTTTVTDPISVTTTTVCSKTPY